MIPKNFPELLGVFGDYRSNRSIGEASSFNLRIARLYFHGHLFSPDLKYYIQLAGETAENAQAPGAISVFDMNADEYALLVECPNWTVQDLSTRSQITPTASMQFAGRALAAMDAHGQRSESSGCITIMNDEEAYPSIITLACSMGRVSLINRFWQKFSSEEPTVGCPGGPGEILSRLRPAVR
ncbi:MAG: hypothetical protein U0361_06365 [Nitrospiraceae bacterium]